MATARVRPQVEADVARTQVRRVEPLDERGSDALEIEIGPVASRIGLQEAEVDHERVSDGTVARDQEPVDELLAEEPRRELHAAESLEREGDELWGRVGPDHWSASRSRPNGDGEPRGLTP